MEALDQQGAIKEGTLVTTVDLYEGKTDSAFIRLINKFAGK